MRVSFDTWITLAANSDDDIEVEVRVVVIDGEIDSAIKVYHEGKEITSLVPQYCFRYLEEQAIEEYYERKDLKGE